MSCAAGVLFSSSASRHNPLSWLRIQARGFDKLDCRVLGGAAPCDIVPEARAARSPIIMAVVWYSGTSGMAKALFELSFGVPMVNAALIYLFHCGCLHGEPGYPKRHIVTLVQLDMVQLQPHASLGLGRLIREKPCRHWAPI
jgi:hypothetical protein